MIELFVDADRPIRLDNYLISQYPHLGTGVLNKFLRENKIKLNNKKLPLSTKVQNGDKVKLFIPDVILTDSVNSKKDNEKRSLKIVFESENFVILHKPAGIAVTSENISDGDTLEVLINRYYQSEQSNCKLLPCHRLDTGTSGLVIFAKSYRAAEHIKNLIRKHLISKNYLCVTFGLPKPSNAKLTGYLIKDSVRSHVIITDSPKNKTALKIETHYNTIATSGRLALLDISLITGRTHQIRAHLASIGCPILGDSKYGNIKANREYRFKYQALCAYKLKFPNLPKSPYQELNDLTVQVEKPWYATQVIDKKIF